MKFALGAIAFLIVGGAIMVGLAWGNLSTTDVLNPTTSDAAARRADAETDVYARESELRLRHLEQTLAEEHAQQIALDQLALQDAVRWMELRRELMRWGVAAARLGFLILAAGCSSYWVCRGLGQLVEELARAGRIAVGHKAEVNLELPAKWSQGKERRNGRRYHIQHTPETPKSPTGATSR